MSRLEIILVAITSISVVFNVFLFFYARRAVSELIYISEELGDIQDMVTSFGNHVKSLYELEMYYGDSTLEALIEHSVSFSEQLETYEYIYSLTDTQQEKTQDEEAEQAQE